MSLTTLLVPSYTQMLQALSNWLEKAQAQGADAEALLSARLVSDMFPLATQIRFACFQAQEPVFRLQGAPLPETLTELAREGQTAGEQPGSLADAQARVRQALDLLGDLPADALDGGAQLSITLTLPNGITFDLPGEEYARDWALPQFYFHAMAAYALLRSNGIELGKADYLQHMSKYLRPGSLPGA